MDQETPVVKKTILILKSNPLSLQSAEQFLRARDWTIVSTTNLTEAIHSLFTSKIDYFLVCANHPHKKVRVLPKVLAQLSTIRLITYTDIASTFNISLLNEMGVPYQIVPPVSGPSIERTIFRIEKEIQQSESNKTGNKKDSAQSNTTIDEKLRDKFNFFLGPDAEEFAQNDENKGPAFIRNDGSQNAGNAKTTGQSPFGSPSNGEAEDPNSGTVFNTSSGSPSGGPSGTLLPLAAKGRSAFTDGGGFPEGPSNSSGGEKAAFTHKKAFINRSPQEKRIEEGIETVLESTVDKGEKLTPIKRIGSTQNCVCLSIASEALRGFLVAAMGHNRRFDDELLLHIQTRLVELFKQEGIPINEDEPLEVKVKQVDFEQWAIEKADFLKKSIHHGNEVALAFFKTEKLTPRFGKAESADMVTIEIEDLVTEAPVRFDVYVYLPTNDKYILYTPKGGIFLASQKERLKSKGIEKMHIKKEATTEAKRYHMENTLNSSISQFKKEANEASPQDEEIDDSSSGKKVK